MEVSNLGYKPGFLKLFSLGPLKEIKKLYPPLTRILKKLNIK